MPREIAIANSSKSLESISWLSSASGVCPTLSRLRILRRRLAHPLDDARIRDRRDGFLDPFNLDLMEPFVAKIESVSENAIRLQIQVI